MYKTTQQRVLYSPLYKSKPRARRTAMHREVADRQAVNRVDLQPARVPVQLCRCIYWLDRGSTKAHSRACWLTHRSLAGFVSPISGLSAYGTCFTVSLTLRPARPPKMFVVCDALTAHGVLYIGTRQDRVDISIDVVCLNQAHFWRRRCVQLQNMAILTMLFVLVFTMFAL